MKQIVCCSHNGLYLNVFCLIKQYLNQPHFDAVVLLPATTRCLFSFYEYLLLSKTQRNGPDVVKMALKINDLTSSDRNL